MAVQIMEAASGQLAAAIYSLIAALLGRRHEGPLLLWCIYNLSFARWGLEGMPINTTVQQQAIAIQSAKQEATGIQHNQKP